MVANPLFSIETNQGFERVNVELNIHFTDVLDSYGLGTAVSIQKIDKFNQLSDLYVIETTEGRFVLRVFDSKHQHIVEIQCQIVSELNNVQTIHPLRCRRGSFVYSVDDTNCFAWMVYPYISGPLFISPETNLLDVAKSGLNFLVALRQWQDRNGDIVRGLPEIKRFPDRWMDLIKRIGNVEDNHLSEVTRKVIDRNLPLLDTIIASACGCQVGPVELAHCDLQHANIIIGPLGPTIIDLEDICLDRISVSAAHAIFKIVRHGVYLELFNADQAYEETVKPLIEWAENRGLFAGGPKKILALAAHRTVGDVHNILVAMETPETAWVSYDLEKKISNMLEIGVLFGMPVNY